MIRGSIGDNYHSTETGGRASMGVSWAAGRASEAAENAIEAGEIPLLKKPREIDRHICRLRPIVEGGVSKQ